MSSHLPGPVTVAGLPLSAVKELFVARLIVMLAVS